MYISVEEQLFRSVEGQAASDEEEERWTSDQQRQVDEIKTILTRLSCCGDRYIRPLDKWMLFLIQKTIHPHTHTHIAVSFPVLRCDERALKRLLSHCGESRAEESYTAVLELLDRVTRLHKQLDLRESQARRDHHDPEQVHYRPLQTNTHPHTDTKKKTSLLKSVCSRYSRVQK